MKKDIITQKQIREYIGRWKEEARVVNEFHEYKEAMRERFHNGAILEEGPVTLAYTEFKGRSTSYKEVLERTKVYLVDKSDLGKKWADRLLRRIGKWTDELTKIDPDRYLITPKEVGEVRVLKTARIAR